uniref:Uncharacterized protein n=1 Tax=Oryza brachyantha TaxID=4533 RepID=J3N9L8_ORYBR
MPLPPIGNPSLDMGRLYFVDETKTMQGFPQPKLMILLMVLAFWVLILRYKELKEVRAGRFWKFLNL